MSFDKPIFVLDLEESLSSIYKKRNLHFLAEVVLEPGSSDPEMSTLPMSYCLIDEKGTLVELSILNIQCGKYKKQQKYFEKT